MECAGNLGVYAWIEPEVYALLRAGNSLQVLLKGTIGINNKEGRHRLCVEAPPFMRWGRHRLCVDFGQPQGRNVDKCPRLCAGRVRLPLFPSDQGASRRESSMALVAVLFR